MKNNIYVYSFVLVCYICITGSFQGAQCKESVCNAGDAGAMCLIPGLGRSPGEEKGYPLQCSGLENSMDCIVHGVTESDMTEGLSLQWYRICLPTQETQETRV